MKKIYNFSAGPSMIPFEVVQTIKKEIPNWHSLGVSVMEISHRSKEFIEMSKTIKQDLRELLNIPKNYKILLCHGGARAQFSAVPGNLLSKENMTADYINTGYWSLSAKKEAEKYCLPNKIDARIINNNICSILPMKEWILSKNSKYLHYCPNETIEGIAIYEEPKFEKKIVVADFSSIILAYPININNYDLIYASAQKNVGIAGLTIVIIREELLNITNKYIPSILNYKTLYENESMFNTPSTFSWYVAGLVLKWLKKNGGIHTINYINKKKSELLYKTIDNSDLYINHISNNNRSLMNISFQLLNKKLEKKFLKDAQKIGLYGLQGHRIIGGIRASIYNAMPIEGVEKLAKFMIDFQENMY
ncbi:3-phosphoserine/phosphohydroxythreonine transaminase [Candidatus Tachikawaea gelatinosa]|nr:3-phosphoserine/phosphohydroxythreonine transaminase [Candidatus Tachikawaea gelatinosa]